TGVEEGFHLIRRVQFVNGDNNKVLVIFVNENLSVAGSTEYARTTSDGWKVAGETKGELHAWHKGMQVTVKEDLNQPPLLTASDGEKSKVLWDPNPQLKNLEMGEVSLYRWKLK